VPWEILPQARERPSCDLLCLSINYCDLLQVRNAHINIGTCVFELEGLGFGTNLIFLIETLVGHRIDRGDGPVLLVVAAANINTLGRCVVAQVPKFQKKSAQILR
jgi:hypothetical protein